MTARPGASGVNPETSSEPLWMSLADCVAVKLISGRPPKVLRAIRLVPIVTEARLRTVNLREDVPIDPMAGDPMVTMVEERQRLRKLSSPSDSSAKRLSDA